MVTFDMAKKQRVPSTNRPRSSDAAPTHHSDRVQVRQILRSQGLQTKLTVNPPNDVYEQEADRVADEVMRMPDPNGGEQWAQRTCLECRDEQVQRQPVEEPEPDEELQ